ncbi:hypothetical protein SA2016_1072 [Sinomonas atrocyanea]|uniref:DUF3263 domain-containing protein n=1 Tax=Sinomonas atrocyanea TaxID=37927 RepID=A0A126ZZC0_9MICC|nr:DUF3263 domain-containing protein [Sinomonas atrocyanea]AMM31755.1 hypothetical protein SA2016_1072 [Sinomonas atrocyanea]GEB66581.1 hypothetical protein SAT01_40290 [Sinomonas atrocyanea]GGG73835.1 hypothetical protein GCM10007172_28130 [Sinomonas atrocyanea]
MSSAAAHHAHAFDDAVDHGPAPASAEQEDTQAGRPAGGLTEREIQMLALERGWWKYAGAKEQAIRELFDLSATHYYQLLNALIDTEDALAHDPMLVKRLRRLRTSRQRARTARRLGGGA